MVVPDSSDPLVWFQLLVSNPSLTPGEFESLWSSVLSEDLPADSTFRMVQDFPREGDLEGEAFSDCPYDAIGEFWREETEPRALNPPSWPEPGGTGIPGNSLIDRGNCTRIPTRANVVMSGGEKTHDEMVKSLFLVCRKSGMSVSEFQDYWALEHAPLVKKTPGLSRYVQYHVHPDVYQSGEDPDYDGVGELRWPDRETFQNSWSSPEIQQEQFRDSPNFLRTGEVISAIVEETVLLNGVF